MLKFMPVLLFALWIAIHIPGIFHGTREVALHQSYVGDEQSPVNGAFHILEEKSLLALRDNKNVYYGPLFSVVALPAVALDGAQMLASGRVDDPEGYKDLILFDWGGIIWKVRLISVVVAYLGLLSCFKLLSLPTVNPGRSRGVAWVGTLLLATNFYFFEYSHFFKHWVFLISGLLSQLYLLTRLIEERGKGRLLWALSLALSVASFGVTYLAAFFQLMWLPVLVRWIRDRERAALRAFLFYALGVVALCSLVILWHPHAFLRTFGLTIGDVAGGGTALFTSEVEAEGLSFLYYAKLVVANHLALVIGWALLLLAASRKLYREVWFSVALLPLVVYFALFGTISHHESRYALPMITLIILHGTYLFAHYSRRIDASRLVKRIVLACAAITVLYHAVHIGAWVRVYAKAPAEQGLIEKLLARPNAGGRILVLDSYILGTAHTAEAYRAYMKATNKEGVNLYRKLLETPAPASRPVLDAYYLTSERFFALDSARLGYDSIVRKNFVRTGELNQFDYIDENIARIWWYDELLPSYSILK
jgi:hypothetical protein